MQRPPQLQPHAHPAGPPGCPRCESPVAEGDLRCAVCGMAVVGHARAPQQVVSRVLRCSECGAAVAYSAEAHAPRCAFCRAVMRVEEPVDPIEQAEWIAPFLVVPQQAHGFLRQWMRTLGFFRPSDLSSAAALESLQPIWFAGWIVNARALVSWTADSDAGSGRSRWAPHSGQTVLSFQNLLVSASRGLAHAECARLAPHYDLASSTHDPRGPTGAIVEQFDAQRSAARKIIVGAIEATAAAQLQAGHIPGRAFRHVKVAVLLNDLETRRVALPAYVLAYRYRRTIYRAIVHGQDARCVFGAAPYSVAKILLVIGGVLLGLALIAGLFALIAALS